MNIYLHDDPNAPDWKPGPDPQGPTHMGTVCVEYEYQAEEWVKDIEGGVPMCVRVHVPALGREWVRINGKMVEQPRVHPV